MKGIYVGKVTRSKVDKNSADLLFVDHRQDIQNLNGVIEFDDTAYCLVPANDIIINNDELLKLRDACKGWEARYAKVNNELFQKGPAYGTLENAYNNEKIAGEMLLKDRDALKEKVDKLEVELTEIKTARTLREAYVKGVEQGCEGLREERDRWKNRWNSVVTDISKSLEANGIEFKLKEIRGDGNWDVVIDIPELNEAKKKVEDLEKKLKAAKFNETFWRGRKEEMESYHHYWLNTYDRVVKQAADKGIHIGVCGNDERCNAGVVVVDNVKAEELEKTNKNLKEKLGAADNALEYWNNTYNDIVIAGKKVGVKIDIKGKRPDSNAGFVYVTNEKTIELSDVKQKQDKKWQAMLDALKAKGVEVIYMGEEDEKPCVDVKIPEIDILKKELEALKSRTLDNVEIRLSYGDIVWTYCDGFVHVSSMFDGVISADQITNGHINCLCKNYFDAESISHGTIPKCSSCTHYVSGSRSRDVWCHKPVSKEGPGTICRLCTEVAEGPACSDFKARKE